MLVKQRFSLLFYLKRSKQNEEGSPIYVRITIDGLRDELSLNVRLQEQYWDVETKTVLDSCPFAKVINDKIFAVRVDLTRHFDLIQVSKGLATPQLVKAAYLSPVKGSELHRHRIQYKKFQATLVNLLDEYVHWCKYWKKLRDRVAELPHIKEVQQAREASIFKKRIESVDREAFEIYTDKKREKSLVMAIDEYIFNFLKGVHTKSRSYTTLEKWLGRRTRYISYLKYRYKENDILLSSLEFSFIGDLVNYNKLIHGVDNNTAINYAKHLKEVIKRSVSNGWLPVNLFASFSCPYTPPKAVYLNMDQFIKLKNHVFTKEYLNVIRDMYVFACYTGLSYSELFRLSPSHIIKGVGGQLWIDISRLKTGGEEPVPLLPPAVAIIEKFQTEGHRTKKHKLLPMPTNEYWNRCQKEMAAELKFEIHMHGHQTRYFFINELTYDNDVSLSAIKQMVGHKKISTTEHYLRNNKKRVSREMDVLKEKLFDEAGSLKVEKISGLPAIGESEVDHPMRVVFIKK